MINFLLSTLYFTSTTAEFKSYDGSNCAFVYDDLLKSSYPLDVCITDYDPNEVIQYQSRKYICTTASDNSVDIRRYIYYAANCDGDSATDASAIGSKHLAQNNAYQCGNSESVSYDDCYYEYKEYNTTSDTCEGWDTSAYKSKYIITGTCVAVDGINTYSYCNPNNKEEVEYVKFNDDMCCDLSYQYWSEEAPAWKDYNIQIGCNNKVFIDAEKIMCNIPDGANDKDVFTDNPNQECTDMGNMSGVSKVVYVVIAYIMYMY